MTAWWSTVAALASATRNSPNQALFEHNEIHGNGTKERRGGIDICDSQNATVEANKFGPATITIEGMR
jgi:hypothetical protein